MKMHQPRPDPSVTERWLVAFARASVMWAPFAAPALWRKRDENVWR